MKTRDRVRIVNAQKTADRRALVRKMVKDMESLIGSEEGHEETNDEDMGSESGGATHIHIHAGGGGEVPSAAGQEDYKSQDEAEGEADPTESRFQALESQHQSMGCSY